MMMEWFKVYGNENVFFEKKDIFMGYFCVYFLSLLIGLHWFVLTMLVCDPN